MFKYQKTRATAVKFEAGNSRFQLKFDEDAFVLQIIEHRNRQFMNNAG